MGLTPQDQEIIRRIIGEELRAIFSERDASAPASAVDMAIQEELEDRQLLQAQRDLSEIDYKIMRLNINAIRLERRGNPKAAKRQRQMALRLEARKRTS